jgi:large subunit ribosomal protein L24e
MPTCSFCKKNYENPRGLTIFTFEGKSLHFCSSKCKRNLDLKRDPKKVNWVKREKKTTSQPKEKPTTQKETPKEDKK